MTSTEIVSGCSAKTRLHRRDRLEDTPSKLATALGAPALLRVRSIGVVLEGHLEGHGQAVWACPQCGQRMRLRAVVLAPATLKILRGLQAAW